MPRALSVSLALLAFAIVGCETVVKRDPLPVSQVRFFTSMDGHIFTTEPVSATSEPGPSRKLHRDYYGRPDCMIVFHGPVSSLTAHGQYVGRITWSGIIPEIDIPESKFESDRLPVPVVIPDRVQAKIKEDAARRGGNVVILDLENATCRWVVENGKLQPDSLFFCKAYYVTNAP